MLDLGQVIAMPFCTMLLADLGARVIKVESPERGRERVSLGVKRRRDGVEERVPAAQYRDRNKLGVTLDLKTPAGVELFRELVRHADVVTENFSVGTMERLGLGYEELRRVNPGLVYASITAFGQTGPYAPQRGYDMLAQAISGYMSITGDPDGPPTRSGQSISDYYAGMLCAFSIVSALHYRQRTGRGQRIDLALLDSLLVALDNLGERYTVGGEILTRAGNVSFAGSATGIYRDRPTATWPIAAAASNAIWARFCAVIGRDELTRDPEFATAAARRDRRDEIAAIIQALDRPRGPRRRWCAPSRRPASRPRRSTTWPRWSPIPRCRRARCSCERDHPVYGPLTTTGTPLKLSETPGRVRWLAPMPGEHNEEVFIGAARPLARRPRALARRGRDLSRWPRAAW